MKMKRFFALLLTLVMIVGLLPEPTHVHAAEVTKDTCSSGGKHTWTITNATNATTGKGYCKTCNSYCLYPGFTWNGGTYYFEHEFTVLINDCTLNLYGSRTCKTCGLTATGNQASFTSLTAVRSEHDFDEDGQCKYCKVKQTVVTQTVCSNGSAHNWQVTSGNYTQKTGRAVCKECGAACVFEGKNFGSPNFIHDFEVTKKINCKTGNGTIVCKYCGLSYTTVGVFEKGNHNYDANGECTVCEYACTTHTYSNGKCTECGKSAPPCAVHTDSSTGKCPTCGAALTPCPERSPAKTHTFGTDGLCSACGAACEHDKEPNLNSFVCNSSGYQSVSTVCTICKKVFAAEIQVKPYSHFLDENGQCLKCDFECQHDFNYDTAINEVPSTCKTYGYKEYKCKNCEQTTKVISTELDRNNHENLAQGEAQEKTCTQDGWEAYEYCTECDYSTKVVIPAGHEPADAVKENEVPATCIAKGSYDEVIYCSVEGCEEELSRETIETEVSSFHMDENKDNSCDNCGVKLIPSEVDIAVKVNTSFDAGDITEELKAAGMTTPAIIKQVMLEVLSGTELIDSILYDLTLMYTEDGKTWHVADEEHFPESGVLYITIPVPAGTSLALNDFKVVHMFSKNAFGKTAGQIETPAVEEIKGADGKEYIGFSITGMSPVLVSWIDHTHEYEGVVTTEPTCTEEGEKTFTCGLCGDSYTEEIEATGHKWDAGKVTTTATEKRDGVITYTCLNDKEHTKTETFKYQGDYDDSHQTGDNTAMILVTMTGVAMLCAAVFVFTKKRRTY